MRHSDARLSIRAATPVFVLALALLHAGDTRAHEFRVLYAFPEGTGQPSAGVILDAAGNLYGTTTGAGLGAGTVFELSPGSGTWVESTVHGFTGGSDGGVPFDALIFDAAGNLYGTTNVGGISCGHNGGCGVVFELSPGIGGWSETVLLSFAGGTDGYYPIASLTLDKEGNLYSTVENGGDINAGQVYELTQGGGQWQKSVLYDFNTQGVGAEPAAAPAFDSAGNLYGTTGCCGSVVFELYKGTWKEKTLSTVDNSFSSLAFDRAGNLYGSTRDGGKYQRGTVFKVTRSKSGKWKHVILHSFKGGIDGDEPYGTPVFDRFGNLYGTTMHGGIPSCQITGCGTVYKLTPRKDGYWEETILHRFTGGADGADPYFVTLALDTESNLYGTAAAGGNSGCGSIGCGVVFEITH